MLTTQALGDVVTGRANGKLLPAVIASLFLVAAAISIVGARAGGEDSRPSVHGDFVSECIHTHPLTPSADACTHGIDPGVPVAEARASAARARSPIPSLPVEFPCTPDGGPVVRVFYGYVGQNRIDMGPVSPRARILQAVASADRLIADGAKATGGVRHVRWFSPTASSR